MKNILIIINSLTGGGAERVATNLATCLNERENVTLVVEHIDGDTYGSTVNTIDLEMPLDKGKFKIFWHLSLAKKLRKIKKELNATYSISFLPEPSLANVLSKCDDTVIVSERNNLSAKKSRVLHMKEKWLMKRADKVVALSEMVKNDIVQNFGIKEENVVTIYNPCYVDSIRKQFSEDVMSNEEKMFFEKNKGNVVITAGRLVDQKGHWHLIRAFKEVVECLPNMKLLILGQGGNKDYLQTLIEELNLQENVMLMGYKANPYVYMKNADLFVFPSIFEGLGNIIVECMACDLPVISTDCKYGPKELLDPGTDYTKQVEDITYGSYGVLVPPLDGVKYDALVPLTDAERVLADAIVKMMSDEKLREGYKRRICERSKDFVPETITQQWVKVLDEFR